MWAGPDYPASSFPTVWRGLFGAGVAAPDSGREGEVGAALVAVNRRSTPAQPGDGLRVMRGPSTPCPTSAAALLIALSTDARAERVASCTPRDISPDVAQITLLAGTYRIPAAARPVLRAALLDHDAGGLPGYALFGRRDGRLMLPKPWPTPSLVSPARSHRTRPDQRLQPALIPFTQDERRSNRHASLSRTTHRKHSYDTRH